jgi:putative peptidoglycan lipid II flippase
MSQQAISISYPPAVDDRRAARAAGFVGHAKLISALTLLSRILGVARESVMARYFGAGVVASAFTVAFRIPNLFRKLLGEGALSASFIPLYAQALKSGDREQANRFAAAAVNLLTVILVVLTVAGETGLWATARFVQLRPDYRLIVQLTAIMLPYVLLICGTAFLGGILQVHRRFALPALAPVLLNVIHIAVIVIGARMLLLTRSSGDERIALQTRLAYWLAGFVVVAGVLQIAMLLPTLRQVGFRPVWVGNFCTAPVKKMLRLSVPVALSAGVLQLSVVLDTAITVVLTPGPHGGEPLRFFGHTMAYPMAVGSVFRLYVAQILYQFPLGVFAIAIGTAIFPGLGADALDRDRGRFKHVLRQGIIFTLLEGLPASLGLIIVRYPIIRLLFQRGRFTEADTHWVALSVVFYAAAIWAFSLQQILNRAYYALHDMTTPLVMSIVTLVLNTAVEIPLSFTRLGEAGIAAGTLVSFAIQAIVMLFMLDRKIGGLGLKSIGGDVFKMLIACGLMGVACWGARGLSFYPHGVEHLAAVGQLAILMGVGAGVYAGACAVMRVWRVGRIGGGTGG